MSIYRMGKGTTAIFMYSIPWTEAGPSKIILAKLHITLDKTSHKLCQTDLLRMSSNSVQVGGKNACREPFSKGNQLILSAVWQLSVWTNFGQQTLQLF